MPLKNRHTALETSQIGEKLSGATILGPIHSDDYSSFGFICKLPNSSKRLCVWIDSDPEGNGAGHLEIEEEK